MAVADKSPMTAASPDDLRRFDRVDALLALRISSQLRV
jgi:hypothetical protein